MPSKHDFEPIMAFLLENLKNFLVSDEIPVFACVIKDDFSIVSISSNKTFKNNDPTSHAELLAIKEAGAILQSNRLDNLTLVSTLEPCLMCSGAVLNSRIKRIVFGAFEPKTGFVSSLFPTIREFNPSVEIISGVLLQECSQIMTNWFSNIRAREI